VNRLFIALLGLMAVSPIGASTSPGESAALPSLEPFIIPLQMHPADTSSYAADPNQVAIAMPRVIHQGENGASDAQQITMPAIVTPTQPRVDEQGNLIGKAGTGFFVAGDGHASDRRARGEGAAAARRSSRNTCRAPGLPCGGGSGHTISRS
jgi:hypothetical protein